MQWATAFYPMGKTSIESRFNLPGKIGWALMEAPGFLNLLYIMFTLPKQNGIEHLPAENWLMAGLFVTLPCLMTVCFHTIIVGTYWSFYLELGAVRANPEQSFRQCIMSTALSSPPLC